MYLMPPGPNAANLSASFLTLLAQDGIVFKVTDAYGQGLGRSQKTNFAPRGVSHIESPPGLLLEAGLGCITMVLRTAGFHRTSVKLSLPVRFRVFPTRR